MAESAGLLMYRLADDRLQVFLAHPGGPCFARKDAGAWTIPKGEIEPGDGGLDTAVREFREETGIEPAPPYHALGSIRQRGGKVVHAWAFEGDWDATTPVTSNTFTMEWPPRSGRRQAFPEIDRVDWYDPDAARIAINPAQAGLIDRLEDLLKGTSCGDPE